MIDEFFFNADNFISERIYLHLHANIFIETKKFNLAIISIDLPFMRANLASFNRSHTLQSSSFVNR